MKICLVGNQNSGKTTLFNVLTGMNQKIGNWPGVTIEKKTGIIKGTNYEIVDLPGIYSLNPYTQEEKVSSNYILHEKPDLIINIIDATCLERSLYLTMQLLELNTNVIVALNMTDILEKKGISIDTQILSEELRTPVCRVSGLKQIGIEELIAKILQINHCSICGKCMYKNKKLNEEEITKRYDQISKIVKKCSKKQKKWINTTESLDRVFLSKTFGIPIFLVIMFSVYFLSVGIVGKYTGEVMSSIVQTLSDCIINILNSLNTPNWVESLIINGIFKGISSVLSFLPQLTALYLCIALLETTGYMSRIAFMLDNIFRKIGLSGNSIIPFIIGSGCSVPGIMSTKIIENSDERKITTILVPFIPCSAKLPIIALFSGYFFKENAGIISFSLYLLAIIVIILSSLFFKKKIFTNTTNSFITELPEYKLPNIKYVIRDVSEKVKAFIKKSGTIILFASIVVWFLSTYSINLKYGVTIDKSILATIGKKISWIFYPILGTNSWEATVSALQGLIAKEQVISSMSIISNLQHLNMGIFEPGATFDFFNKASAYSFIVFNLFSAPCFASIIAMNKQLGSIRKTIFAIIYQITVAWAISTLIYQAALLIF